MEPPAISLDALAAPLHRWPHRAASLEGDCSAVDIQTGESSVCDERNAKADGQECPSYVRDENFTPHADWLRAVIARWEIAFDDDGLLSLFSD